MPLSKAHKKVLDLSTLKISQKVKAERVFKASEQETKKKENGIMSILIPNRYRFDCKIGQAHLVGSFRCKIIINIRSDVFIGNCKYYKDTKNTITSGLWMPSLKIIHLNLKCNF